MHILIFGISIFEGMAGTRRLQNNLLNGNKEERVKISNLILAGNIKKSTSFFEGIDALKVEYNIYNPFTFFRFLHAGKRFIKSMFTIGVKNILYVYGYPTINNISLIKYARKLGYKIVFDIVEDNHFISDFKSPLSYIKNKTSLYYLKKLDGLCDGCIVISNHLLAMVKKYIGNKPIIKIPISVNLIDFQLGKKTIDKDEVINLFYGGSFGPKDGLDILLEALRIVSIENCRVRLLLTGVGAQRHMDTVFSMIKEKKIEHLVDYKGFLPDKSYYETMMIADIFCMVRIDTAFSNAGFPFKLGEMLASGKPVIATKIGEIKEYLDKDSAILIEPGEAAALADAILFLINNPQQAVKIGIEGKKKAIQNFDSNKISQDISTFFNIL